jgi:hypothetical protein
VRRVVCCGLGGSVRPAPRWAAVHLLWLSVAIVSAFGLAGDVCAASRREKKAAQYFVSVKEPVLIELADDEELVFEGGASLVLNGQLLEIHALHVRVGADSTLRAFAEDAHGEDQTGIGARGGFGAKGNDGNIAQPWGVYGVAGGPGLAPTNPGPAGGPGAAAGVIVLDLGDVVGPGKLAIVNRGQRGGKGGKGGTGGDGGQGGRGQDRYCGEGLLATNPHPPGNGGDGGPPGPGGTGGNGGSGGAGGVVVLLGGARAAVSGGVLEIDTSGGHVGYGGEGGDGGHGGLTNQGGSGSNCARSGGDPGADRSKEVGPTGPRGWPDALPVPAEARPKGSPGRITCAPRAEEYAELGAERVELGKFNVDAAGCLEREREFVVTVPASLNSRYGGCNGAPGGIEVESQGNGMHGVKVLGVTGSSLRLDVWAKGGGTPYGGILGVPKGCILPTGANSAVTVYGWTK